MIRVYFDWNVVSNLHSSHVSVKVLSDFLNDEHGSICIPYSDAHLRDIKRGAKKSNCLVSSRLDYLSSISHNNYMSYDVSAKMVMPYIVHPKEAYADVAENRFDNMNLLDVLDEIDDDSDFKIGQMIKAALSSIPNPHFSREFPVSDNPYLHSVAQSISNAPSFLGFLQAVTEFANTTFRQPDSYRELRESLRTGLIIQPHQLSSTEKPLERIEHEIRRISGNEQFTFMEAIRQMKKDSPQFQSVYTDFYALYCILEFMGYHSDRINNKNKPENMLTDIQHAFYGAHCDYFVTQDNKAVTKAAQVYKELQLTSKALTVDAFIDDVRSCYLGKQTFQSVVSSVSETIRSQECLQSHVTPQVNEIIQAYLFKPSMAIMNYFNYLEYMELKNRFIVLLLHIDSNLSGFIFYDEIKMIVADFYSMLGLDYAGKGEITDDELGNLSLFERQWIVEPCLFSLIINPEYHSVSGILTGDND